MGREFDLDHIFASHSVTPDQVLAMEAIREGAKGFATLVKGLTPPSADQSAAIRLISDAMMTANAAIARGGRLHK